MVCSTQIYGKQELQFTSKNTSRVIYVTVTSVDILFSRLVCWGPRAGGSRQRKSESLERLFVTGSARLVSRVPGADLQFSILAYVLS